ELVIFDDFYGTEKYCDMLRWLSENPIKVPIKGSMVDLLATKFIITSNVEPDRWYPHMENKQGLTRRITDIIYMDHIHEPYTKLCPIQGSILGPLPQILRLPTRNVPDNRTHACTTKDFCTSLIREQVRREMGGLTHVEVCHDIAAVESVRQRKMAKNPNVHGKRAGGNNSA
ncbi:putative replication associated protein, partial [Gregarina niphandrodes]